MCLWRPGHAQLPGLSHLSTATRKPSRVGRSRAGEATGRGIREQLEPGNPPSYLVSTPKPQHLAPGDSARPISLLFPCAQHHDGPGWAGRSCTTRLNSVSGCRLTVVQTPWEGRTSTETCRRVCVHACTCVYVCVGGVFNKAEEITH